MPGPRPMPTSLSAAARSLLVSLVQLITPSGRIIQFCGSLSWNPPGGVLRITHLSINFQMHMDRHREWMLLVAASAAEIDNGNRMRWICCDRFRSQGMPPHNILDGLFPGLCVEFPECSTVRFLGMRRLLNPDTHILYRTNGGTMLCGPATMTRMCHVPGGGRGCQSQKSLHGINNYVTNQRNGNALNNKQNGMGLNETT